MTEKKLDEAKGMSPGYDSGDPKTSGNPHANRIADKSGAISEPTPKLDDKANPLSKIEIINYVLKQLSMTDGDASQALYNSLKAQMEGGPDGTSGKKSGNEGNLKSIATKEDIDPVFAGFELSEEAKDKAFLVFEAAVGVKSAERIAQIEEEFSVKLTEEVAAMEEGLVEKIDAFFDYVAEEWMNRNELAVESGLRAEMAESFIAGMKSLFESHYVELPEEKVNVVESLTDKVEELTKKLNEQVEASIGLTQKIEEMKVETIFKTVSEGLTDTQKGKLSKLVENIEYADAEEFASKVTTLKESFNASAKKTVLVEDSLNGGEPLLEEKKESYMTPEMAQYVKAASRIQLK